MSRKKRVYFNNVVYHVTIRGNNRQMVLKEEEDKEDFLETLNRFKRRFQFELFGFVIMDNHVHMVIGVDNGINISKVMQSIALSYSCKFRHKYEYTGYVWQGRFNSPVIDSDEYIIACLEYIHNNPVRAGIVKNAGEYKWSSYHFYERGINPLAALIELDKFTA
jgi:putative transposase